MPQAAVVTIGDELLCGDVSNTNARWLGRELEQLGMGVRIMATLPDDRGAIATFLRWARDANDYVLVTGGLGPTPDDVTRAAVADAFSSPREIDAALAEELRSAGGHGATFAPEWASLPAGSRVLPRTPGGAPAFAIENVYVLAGAPAEMRVSFRGIRDELRAGPARNTWRKTYAITEDRLSGLLDDLQRRHGEVSVGSYPNFGPRGAEVELVLRARRRAAVDDAAARVERALGQPPA